MSIPALVLALVVALAACGGDKKSKPAPEKPSTGAPVAVVVDKLGKEALDVSVYNFADQPIGMYWFLIRYKDKDGKVVIVKPGTPFEKDHTFITVSGNKYKTNPKSWSSMQIEPMDIPEGAASAEVIVRSVNAISKDGATIETESLWELDADGWPEGQ